MTCSYCGTRKDESEHRCRRCGRRPEDTLNGQAPVYRTAGALATQARPTAMRDEAPFTRVPNMAEAVQRSLFMPNVVTMPNRRVPRSAAPPRSGPSGTTGGTRAQSRRTPRPPAPGQEEFEFFEPAPPKTKTLPTTVDAVIYCEAPVATPLHRALAAAIDLTMVTVGCGLFLLTFILCGGEVVLNRPNLILLGCALGLIAGTYGLFWTIAGTETFGMRWTHLRLITFEGFPPDTWQRAARLAGTCLSIFSVLGILWCLADEEGLGWQDHISRTFPTAHELESRVFRRR